MYKDNTPQHRITYTHLYSNNIHNNKLHNIDLSYNLSNGYDEKCKYIFDSTNTNNIKCNIVDFVLGCNVGEDIGYHDYKTVSNIVNSVYGSNNNLHIEYDNITSMYKFSYYDTIMYNKDENKNDIKSKTKLNNNLISQYILSKPLRALETLGIINALNYTYLFMNNNLSEIQYMQNTTYKDVDNKCKCNSKSNNNDINIKHNIININNNCNKRVEHDENNKCTNSNNYKKNIYFSNININKYNKNSSYIKPNNIESLYIDEYMIKQCHKICMYDVLKLDNKEHRAGEYRVKNVGTMTDNGFMYYTDFHYIEYNMMSLIDMYNSNVCDIKSKYNKIDIKDKNSMSNYIHDIFKLAAYLSYEFVTIHPFIDGNGRVARLLCNFVLRHIIPFNVSYNQHLLHSNRCRKDYIDAIINVRNDTVSNDYLCINNLVEMLIDTVYYSLC